MAIRPGHGALSIATVRRQRAALCGWRAVEPQCERRLREAAGAMIFLDRMVYQEGRAFGDKEPFDFYLGAYLNGHANGRLPPSPPPVPGKGAA